LQAAALQRCLVYDVVRDVVEVLNEATAAWLAEAAREFGSIIMLGVMVQDFTRTNCQIRAAMSAVRVALCHSK
jgi:hypothetical protein